MSGIGVYLKNILRFWKSDLDIDLVLVGDYSQLGKDSEFSSCNIIHCDIPPFSVKELISFPVKEVNKCDVYYTPNFNIPFGITIPIYSTIHDVVFLDVPDIVSFLGRIVRKVMLKRAFFISKKIFTVSQFSKSRIQYHFGTKKEIIVAYNGINHSLQTYISQKDKSIYNFEYFLFVGNIKKHKGLITLIRAFEILQKNQVDAKLVIVGDINNFKTSDLEAKRLIDERKENIIFTGKIDDISLYQIIENSKALVQPSVYEGFGIPPLEALYLGVSAIISDIPVFEELYSELPVVFFSNGSFKDLASKMGDYKNTTIDKPILKKRICEKYSYKTSSKIILDNIIN